MGDNVRSYDRSLSGNPFPVHHNRIRLQSILFQNLILDPPRAHLPPAHLLHNSLQFFPKKLYLIVEIKNIGFYILSTDCEKSPSEIEIFCG